MKNEAQAFLEQYEMLYVQIECLQAEWHQWRDLAHSITAMVGGERVQSSGSHDKMASAVTKCLAVEDDILRQIERLIDKKDGIKRTLAQLDKPTEYSLLHQRYIQFKQLKTIADNFGASYDWATTTHGRALKSLQKILDERGAENAEGL